MKGNTYRVVEPGNNESLELDEKVDLQKVDEVLAGLGNYGKFQLKILLITMLMAYVACWRILVDLFSAKYCPWRCTEIGLSMNCTESGLAGDHPCLRFTKLVYDPLIDLRGIIKQTNIISEVTAHCIISSRYSSL